MIAVKPVLFNVPVTSQTSPSSEIATVVESLAIATKRCVVESKHTSTQLALAGNAVAVQVVPLSEYAPFDVPDATATIFDIFPTVEPSSNLPDAVACQLLAEGSVTELQVCPSTLLNPDIVKEIIDGAII